MSLRILIVDDEFGLADVIAEVLAEAGYDAAIAINGELGLLDMSEQAPDLVLLDVMMPVLDGPAMLRKLRADPRFASIPVVMMTSLPEALRAEDAALCQDVLDKPFSQDVLLATIRKWLASKDAPAE
jgi:CheY-like chemotaxis protein